MEHIELIIAIVSTLLVALTQIAAIVGKPKAISKVQVVSKIFDLLTGNHRKAENKD